MQKPRLDLETRTAARAVMAGDAAVKSDRHISKKRVRAREQVRPRDRRKRGEPADQEERRT
jgi:hypothetical protein